jgi:hypothetical protein
MQTKETLQPPAADHDSGTQSSQQHTGNHKPAGAPDSKGADRFGGTRTGAENIEKPA